MAPTQVSTQRVENLLIGKLKVKLAKIGKVGIGKTFAKFMR